MDTALVGHWPFEHDYVDVSPSASTAERHGDLPFADGHDGRALRCGDGYLKIVDADQPGHPLHFDRGYTISAWIRPEYDVAEGWHTMVAKMGDGSDGDPWYTNTYQVNVSSEALVCGWERKGTPAR